MRTVKFSVLLSVRSWAPLLNPKGILKNVCSEPLRGGERRDESTVFFALTCLGLQQVTFQSSVPCGFYFVLCLVSASLALGTVRVKAVRRPLVSPCLMLYQGVLGVAFQ